MDDDGVQVPSEDPASAPAPVRLMNTLRDGPDGVHDELRTVEDLRGWLSGHVGLLFPSGDGAPSSSGRGSGRPAERRTPAAGAISAGTHLDQSDLGGFLRLRDALRRVALLRTGPGRRAAGRSPVAPTVGLEQAVADINQAVSLGMVWPQLELDGRRLSYRPAGATSVATRSLSAVACQAVELFTGDQVLLRVCAAPGCALYFVANRPDREWCSTACGNGAPWAGRTE